ncbi:MAG: acyl--CoA ligase [Myxococcales bacterium]|nr:acyl--CoA ligase [Myxococcales bacterium]
MNATGAFFRRAAEAPNAIAVEDADGTTMNYGELARLALRFAMAFTPGERVSVCAPNSPTLIAAWLGILAARAVVVPLSVTAPPAEQAERRRRTGARRHLDTNALETLSLGDALDGPLSGPATDLALLLSTSGTTGEARFVAIGHGSLVRHTASLVSHALDLGPNDRIGAILPLAHSFGARMVLLVGLAVGATLVLPPSTGRSLAARWPADARLTWLPTVPTQLAIWADSPKGHPGCLRWILSAGAPLPAATRLATETRFGCPVREAWGMTEASIATVDGPPLQPAPGSVGTPVPGVELRLTDLGEVLVRGENVMLAYLDDPEGTAAVVDRDGWVHSGDLGRLDGEGRLFLHGRSKDVILRGGNTIHPAEVEAALLGAPGLVACAVFGTPCPQLGEEIVVAAVGDATLESLREWARSGIAAYKLPTRLFPVDTLPYGPSGKVMRRVVAAEYHSGRGVSGK